MSHHAAAGTSPFAKGAVPVVAFALMAAVAACAGDHATTPLRRSMDAALAKNDCNASTNLRITMRDLGSDAIRSDGGGDYVEGVAGVGAHLSGVNGNLMLNVGSSSRTIAWSSTAGGGSSNDRLYTNSHNNPGGASGCGLYGMVVGSTGSAVLTLELLAGATNSNHLIHYGKSCDGSSDAATRVTTTHPDDDTWVITGAAGRHCTPKPTGKGAVQSGTTGAFELTLRRS